MNKLSLLLLLASVAYQTWDVEGAIALRCKGVDSGCCTADTPCEKGDGDCDRDSDCAGGLTCGSNNCKNGPSPWDDADDCCEGEKYPNKCKENNGGCSHSCASLMGVAKCSCPTGYALGADKKTCASNSNKAVVLNKKNNCWWKCKTGKCDQVCGAGGYCCRRDGRWKAGCPSDMYAAALKNYHTCIVYKPSVVDKCKENNGGCSHSCVSVKGVAKCSCPNGYALGADKKTCADVDECSTGAANCEANAVCSNTAGGYSCSCKPGFQLKGNSCTDVNECSTGSANCEANSVCVNTVGGYSCKCKPGFQLSGKSCADINECSKGKGGCSHTCVNTAGGYRCTCPSGFTLSANKKTCSDINECSRGKGGCSHTCVNTNGGFRCTCPSGYQLHANKRTCQRKPCRSACVVETFEHGNFKGRRDVYTTSTGMVRQNDKMSSFKVSRGCCVTMYEHGNFNGRNQRFCGNVGWVGNGWNDKISSLRISGSGTACQQQQPQQRCVVETFEHGNFKGRRDVYSASTGMVRQNDKMSSFKVSRGCCVTIYEHGNFNGRNQRFCGNVGWVGNGWNDKVSSLRISRG